MLLTGLMARRGMRTFRPESIPVDDSYGTTVENSPSFGDLVLWHRLGESSGTTASDEQGTLDGTYEASGVTYGQDSIVAETDKTSVAFDGAAGFLTLAYAAAHDLLNGGLILHFMPEDLNQSQGLWAKNAADLTAGDLQVFYYQPDDTLRTVFQDASQGYAISAAGQLEAGVVHTLAVVWGDATPFAAYLRKEGSGDITRLGTHASYSGTISGNGEPIYIGKVENTTDGPFYFKGRMQEVQLYGARPSEATLETLMQGTIVEAELQAIMVSADGDDSTGDGSLATPYQSLAKALEDLDVERRTIYMRETGGPYPLAIHDYATGVNEPLPGLNGSAGARVTVATYPDDLPGRATIVGDHPRTGNWNDAPAKNGAYALHPDCGNHVTFEDQILTEHYQSIWLYQSCDQPAFRRCIIIPHTEHGIYAAVRTTSDVSPCTGALFEDCIILGRGPYSQQNYGTAQAGGFRQQGLQSNGGVQDSGSAWFGATGANFIFRNCLFVNIGYAFFLFSGMKGCLIEDCTMWGSQIWGIRSLNQTHTSENEDLILRRSVVVTTSNVRPNSPANFAILNIGYIASSSDWESDSNVYLNVGLSAAASRWEWMGGGIISGFDNWQITSGQDANSAYGDPGLAAPGLSFAATGPYTSPNTGNFEGNLANDKQTSDYAVVGGGLADSVGAGCNTSRLPQVTFGTLPQKLAA